ncbi:MAG: thiamine pyrophosphate-binding protein [Burkholderiaceae bacterium]|nr:thiamine pyrophosphate-binding protein [Burkholderiaceae bacterium]
MSATPTLRLNGAQVLVRLLEAEGVQQAFGLVGGKLAPLLQAISQSRLQWTGVRHEAAAPMMAAAVHARSGGLALALAEMGPGSLNLAAGTGLARNNHLALLLVTSNQHRAAAYPHRGMFMDLDTRAVLAPLTKWNAVVHDLRRLPELLRTALRQALGGRPGPVHLDIPQDLLAETLDWPLALLEVPPSAYRALHRPRPAAAAVQQAAALLAGARRPLLLAGGGVIAAGAEASLQALARRLRAPLLPTQMALGLVASSSPDFIGQGGLIAGPAVLQALRQADVVLAVGCRFSSWLWDEQGPLVRSPQALINLNIDEQALGQPALHALALHGDAREGLQDLLQALENRSMSADPDWLPGLRRLRQADEQQLQQLADAPSAPGQAMHPAALAHAIGQALPDDALVVYDGGHTTFWSNDLTPVHEPRSRFHDPGMSQLGFGLPYALALKRLHPERPVFNLTGDGSFGFTLQELDTARREGLAVVTVVHNNAAWGVIRAGQHKAGFEFGSGLAGTDHAAIARGFGCHGETVSRPEDLAPALQRALASGLPAVLDCITRFEPHPCMPAFGAMNRAGFAL